jgi:catechol 2,3-dioxygenase-like lactoylglutathione lyase family enzyme
MSLKNILIVVSDIDRSKKFYHDLFGMQVIRDFGDNVILSEGLVLQEKSSWEHLTGEGLVMGNSSELFFEDNDIDSFLHKLEKYQIDAEEELATIGMRENSWGKRVVMFRDPDRHLIEVAEK